MLPSAKSTTWGGSGVAIPGDEVRSLVRSNSTAISPVSRSTRLTE